MTNAIIQSFLDTDLYKFTMMQCVFHQFPSARARYRFNCRKNIPLSDLKAELDYQIAQLAQLNWHTDELNYLANLPYIKPDFIAYISKFKFNCAYVNVSIIDDQLSVVIDGPWLETILFEVPILAIISEIYYKKNYPNATLHHGRARLKDKIAYIKHMNAPQFKFSDFGTRRRYSKDWHQELVKTLKDSIPDQFIGTSNVWLAKKYHLKPIGTMAHEYLQAAQVLAPHFLESQRYALQTWAKEYPNQLGIALTDVFAMDVFLKDFDYELAMQYDGLRQDSGNPIEWAAKAINHYHKLKIDPLTKQLVFSNGLTFEKALDIYNQFKNKTQLFFGIGTHLTNDLGYETLDIVIKMTHTNGKPVIKISDSPGKVFCESQTLLNYVKKVFNL